ncbi:Pfam:DUF894 [Seminavis robusta]|uniref:Pfam:DUF894 n=1 Tax=Seminavis robusta TaxID=568900 RepID=A0A9N8D9F0_9STRA|nr:Pfam:DUF894 [Seminavis robusta]|eukprot:Sro4_g003450.1 Pfam:DUF894 (551) ;mRNA; r:154124-155877
MRDVPGRNTGRLELDLPSEHADAETATIENQSTQANTIFQWHSNRQPDNNMKDIDIETQEQLAQDLLLDLRSQCGDETQQKPAGKATLLVFNNREFRLFLFSFMLARIGGWLTYIASITMIEEKLLREGEPSQSAVSVLIACRFLPIVLLSPFGGVLADGYDRRQSMIRLDLLGAACPLLFLVAIDSRSPIALVYLITLLQQSITGLYEPCKSALTPMLVSHEDELKTATTLLGLCWSVFAALGSSLGGLIVSRVGLRACFFTDCFTFLASAFLIWLMGGEWAPPKSTGSDCNSSLCSTIGEMTADGIGYLWQNSWGVLVLLKASVAILCGAADILNVSLSETPGSSATKDAANLGCIFAFVGFGSFLGSLVVNYSTDMKQLRRIQMSCIVGLGFTALGCFGIGVFPALWTVCLFTAVRSVGTSVTWISSSLLIQKLSAPGLLGRVSAVDGAFALLSESSSALFCGFLQDSGMTPSGVAVLVSMLGTFLTAIWSIHHARGGGASSVLEDDEKSEHTISENTPLLLSDSESDFDDMESPAFGGQPLELRAE